MKYNVLILYVRLKDGGKWITLNWIFLQTLSRSWILAVPYQRFVFKSDISFLPSTGKHSKQWNSQNVKPLLVSE